jgi:hypothetical protein
MIYTVEAILTGRLIVQESKGFRAIHEKRIDSWYDDVHQERTTLHCIANRKMCQLQQSTAGASSRRRRTKKGNLN